MCRILCNPNRSTLPKEREKPSGSAYSKRCDGRRYPAKVPPVHFDDTIAAIATPLGEGGLAVLRISGTDALGIADKIFVPEGAKSLKPSAAPTHTIHFGKVVREG